MSYKVARHYKHILPKSKNFAGPHPGTDRGFALAAKHSPPVTYYFVDGLFQHPLCALKYKAAPGGLAQLLDQNELCLEGTMRHTMLILALLFLLATTATGQAAYGDWRYHSEFDGFTDADRSAVSTASTSGMEATLEFLCTAEGQKVVYRVDGHLGGNSRGHVQVRHRVDRGEVTDRSPWWIMPDRESAWMPVAGLSDFRGKALAGQTVLFELTDPSDGTTWQNRFSLMGLSAALGNLTCD